MKRKLFAFLVLVAACMCIFIFSVTATDVEWGEITYGGQCNTPTVIDTTSRIKMSDGKIYPAYYFVWNTAEFRIEFTKSKLTKDDGSNYTITDIVMLEIPEGVTNFSNYNNSDNYRYNLKDAVNLTYVKLPSTVTDTATNTFANCTSLVTADLSKLTVTKLSSGLFLNCTSLENVILSELITSLSSSANTSGNGVFEGCSSLESLNVPNVTYVGRKTFSGCKSFDIKCLKNITEIGDYAFEKCGLTSFELPGTVTSIGQYSFANNNFTSLTIPNTLMSIGDYAFSNCTNLVTVNPCNGNNLTSLGTYVFYGCTSLNTAYFPTYYATIPASTFENCTALNTLYLSQYVTKIESRAFYNAPWTLVFKYTGTKAQMEALQKNTGSGFQSGTGLIYEKGAETGELPNDKRFGFYGYNICEVFYNNQHIYSGNATLSFVDYLTSFTENDSCTICNSQIMVASYNAILDYLGHSVKETDESAMCVGYNLDKTALNAYKKYNSGKTIEIGLVASAIENGEETDVLSIQDGKIVADELTIAVPVSETYNSFEFKLTGFTSDYMDIDFVMCAYVSDGTNLQYIMESCVSSPTTVSMNQVINQ